VLSCFAGVNALQTASVATIQRVGLLPVKDAQKQYKLVAAHAYLTGGQSKQMGRRTLITKEEPYGLTVQLAYTTKQSVK
jgi:hypothetical protein